MNKKRLKPYVAVILIVLYGLDIFWLSGVIVEKTGSWGILLYEALLAVIAVAVAFVFRADIKRVFPFARPKALKVVGTLVLWLGSILAAFVPTGILMYVFPEKMLNASQSVGGMMTDLPFWMAFILIGLTPAIFEELSFRGALFSCFRGFKSKWVPIIIVGLVFGMFHGSFWRFVPTAILGIAMGYLLVETDNMFYNMLFHLVNNTLPLLLLQIMGGIAYSMNADSAAAAELSYIPLMVVAYYFMYGSASPLLIYAGDYLIHKGQPGYQNGFLPREKKTTFLVLVALSVFLMMIGMVLLGLGFIVDMDFLTGFY